MVSVDEKKSSKINHDDEVFALLFKILSAPLITVPGEVESERVFQLGVEITPEEIFRLAEKFKKSFLEQPALLVINNDPINIVADMHGQSVHLLRILLTCEPPPGQKYLFLGDYVDRGSQSILVMCLLLCLKHRYPHHVYLLRGNHEDINPTLNYGFYDECLEQWNNEELGAQVWKTFIEVFNCMPLAALVGNEVFCAHGGISPWLEAIEDINSIERPLVIPPYGLPCDLLWSDPAQPDKDGWGLSHRGISFTYGRTVLEEFCARNEIALVIRGHQLFKEMYPYGCVIRFGGRLLSLFSALNYEGHKNNSSVLKLEFNDRVRVKQVLYRCRHYAPIKSAENMGCRDMKAMSTAKRKWPKLDGLLGRNCK